MNELISENTVYYFEYIVQEWGMYIAAAVLLIEIIALSVKQKLTLNIVGDTLANFFTFGMFYVFSYILIGAAYVAGFFWIYLNFSFTQLPINGWTILACIILADLTYYWEHRFLHRTGFGWSTHTVHHSSPHFNISVAYRFGPLDGVMPFAFHIPLLLLGFNPLLVLVAEGLVQLYQTILHTQLIKKLPRPIEWLFNTPSHHRVHHGSNPEYIDKNYGGIFIIWDRIFDSFAEERTPVTFGITSPVNTVNPLKIFFIGMSRLGKQIMETDGIGNKLSLLITPPDAVFNQMNSNKNQKLS